MRNQGKEILRFKSSLLYYVLTPTPNVADIIYPLLNFAWYGKVNMRDKPEIESATFEFSRTVFYLERSAQNST